MRVDFAEFFLLLGLLISFIASIGLLRFPDLLCRMHALSKVTTLGLACILTGLVIVFFQKAILIKALITFFIVLIMSPLSAHLLARALFRHVIRNQ